MFQSNQSKLSLFAAAVAALVGLGAGSVAHADGFECLSEQEGLSVKAYNHTDADLGTRNAAILIVSDTTVQQGRRTIATFESSDLLLSQSGATYVAKVDLRFAGSSRKGENLASTKLGFVDELVLTVDFSFASPVAAGTELDATLHIVKRDGEVIEVPMVCARYLKN
jgi:hypothetical protein